MLHLQRHGPKIHRAAIARENIRSFKKLCIRNDFGGMSLTFCYLAMGVIYIKQTLIKWEMYMMI